VNDLHDNLSNEFQDPEYRYAYAESFLNTKVATQIKVLREARGLTQADLGLLVGTKQSGFSRFEDVNHSSWKTDTLWKIARGLGVRVDINFETFGSLIEDKKHFNRESLLRPKFEDDPVFHEAQVPSEPAKNEVAAVSDQAVGDATILLPPESVTGLTHTFEVLQNAVVPAVRACVESWEPALKKLSKELAENAKQQDAFLVAMMQAATVQGSMLTTGVGAPAQTRLKHVPRQRRSNVITIHKRSESTQVRRRSHYGRRKQRTA